MNHLLKRFLCILELLWSEYDVDPNWCEVAVKSYVEENSEMFPMEIGSDYTQEQKNQMTLFLVSIKNHFMRIPNLPYLPNILRHCNFLPYLS